MPRYRNVDIPLPADMGTHDGLSYALYLPPGPPRGGVVVLHGAGSCKESHFDFARSCRARDLAAVCFDMRGHGDSGGALGAGAIDDVATIAELLPPGPRFLRGSSMGGFLALAAAGRLAARAVAAVCPAEGAGLLRGLRDGRLGFTADHPGLDELVAAVDLPAAAATLGEDLLLLHAEGDEQVPVEHSAQLHAAAPGSRFIRAPGGHHRSLQHDGELQNLTARFFADRAGGPPAHGG